MELIESGGKVVQETRLYNVDTGQTVGMRSKEHAHDYRYFPGAGSGSAARRRAAGCDEVKSALPELPQDRRDRFVNEYGLREYDAQVLTLTRATGDYFEAAVKVSGDGRATANWVVGDLMGIVEGGRERDHRFAGVRPESGRTGRADQQGRTDRQAGERDSAEDVRDRRFARGHHGSRRIEADLGHRRTRADRRRKC